MPRTKAQTAALLSSPEDTEAQFYEALLNGDLDSMMAVWAEDEDISCVPPSGNLLMGHAEVRAAFEALFEHSAVQVRVEHLRRQRHGDVAMHLVAEHVQMSTPEGPRDIYLLATNVYLQTAQGWRMVLHHASPTAPEERSGTADGNATLH
ncbi:YybH family protein [Roseateles sp. BYS180W]|uniref:YybH family protein n=1 Tax=Roseateles rivi TaxID=3299028 RepID=A0ABW7FUB4_9BURK